MSSTRTAKPGGPLNQGKFSSSPELNRGIMANLVAPRCALVESAADRELIWFVQYLSHSAGGLKKMATDLIQKYGQRIGTASMLEFGINKGQIYSASQVKAVRVEIPFELRAGFLLKGEIGVESVPGEKLSNAVLRQMADDALSSLVGEIEIRTNSAKQPVKYSASDFFSVCRDEMDITKLERWLMELCVDPESSLKRGPWYFTALVDCLREFYSEWIVAQRAQYVVTELGSMVEEELDYTLESRRMTLIDGLARIGKTFSAKAWCEQNPGRVRFVEVPSSNDDIAFFRAIAKSLGVTSRLSAKAQELRLRIEETLQSGQLGLVLDEAHYLWPNLIDSRSLPSRVNWLMTALVNKGVPVCLIATPQFMRNQRALENRTRWTSEQFTGRLGHYLPLPDSLSESDLAKVAQSLLPEGEAKAIELLVCYAKCSAKYLAGLDAVVARARYLARKQQRDKVIVADIKAAIRESVIPSDSALALALAEHPKRTGRGALTATPPPINSPFNQSETAGDESLETVPASSRRAMTPTQSGQPALARDHVAPAELISG